MAIKPTKKKILQNNLRRFGSAIDYMRASVKQHFIEKLGKGDEYDIALWKKFGFTTEKKEEDKNEQV